MLFESRSDHKTSSLGETLLIKPNRIVIKRIRRKITYQTPFGFDSFFDTEYNVDAGIIQASSTARA